MSSQKNIHQFFLFLFFHNYPTITRMLITLFTQYASTYLYDLNSLPIHYAILFSSKLSLILCNREIQQKIFLPLLTYFFFHKSLFNIFFHDLGQFALINQRFFKIFTHFSKKMFMISVNFHAVFNRIFSLVKRFIVQFSPHFTHFYQIFTNFSMIFNVFFFKIQINFHLFYNIFK